MNKRFAGVVFSILSALPAAAQITGDDIGWVQVEAQPTLSAAQNAIRGYATNLEDVNGFYMGSGWYVITLGPYSREDAEALRRDLRRSGAIPNDAFIADGSRYGQQFWPIGTGAANTVQALPSGATSPAAEDPAPEAVVEAAPEVQEEPIVEAAPEPQPEPDETFREAQASEALLTRNEKMDLQMMLQWAGFYSAAIDGSFGRGTRGSMSEWQAANGFEATGVMTTRQRAELARQFNAVLEGMNLTIVRDDAAGIEIKIPSGVVEFDEYEPPFAKYKSKGDLGARVVLISQPGDQDRFAGLYEILQTLEIIPTDGPRSRGKDSFEIEGKGSKIHSYTYATLVDGEIKGFSFIWPNGDEERRTRVLEEMKASFARIEGTLDPAVAALDEDQSIDLISGLAVRQPKVSYSGFFVDQSGTVLTTTSAVDSCERITIQKDHDADVVHRDDALGIAVLKSRDPLAPMGVAQFQSAVPRLQSEVAVAGFSYGGVLPTPTLTFGTLADMRGLNGEEELKRFALKAQDGDAGGPVFDNGGAVLGMLIPRAQDGKVLPAEVGFAVDSDAIIASLGDAGIRLTITDTMTYMPPETLTNAASDMTVLVSCW